MTEENAVDKTRSDDILLVAIRGYHPKKLSGDFYNILLGNDPHGSGMPWFQKDENESKVDLEGRLILNRMQFTDGGRCLSDGEIDYYSPAGRFAQISLDMAPEGTEVVLFSYEEGVGSKTWIGNYLARYFGKKN